jgi:phosphonate degradation associated HDIG domain protein
MPNTVDELIELYRVKGNEHYGEGVNQLSHALQCAALAQNDGADDTMVAAAFLHDVGHLVADVQGDVRYDLSRDDDVHEAVGARVLSPIFGPRVSQPVSLHVTAKRWRCTTEPTYFDRLSPTSQATLVAQGGLLSEEECRRFEAHPGFERALSLRVWDDDGKRPAMATPSLEEMSDLLRRLATVK